MEKKRIKTELMIHDLKNPLAIIEAGINFLIEREDKYGPVTEKQLKVLRRTLRNTKIARGLVNDILEVGRSSEGVTKKDKFLFSEFLKFPLIEIFDLTDDQVAERIRECKDLTTLKGILLEKGINLIMHEDLWSQYLNLDLPKLKQILRNLLTNALKYRKKNIDLELILSNNKIQINISDDGEGIKKMYHEKIFECYFQLDDEREHCIRGHGLGLAGVLILVEDMGGEIRLESDEGLGAKFLVSIPLDK
jgi:two-component system, OmpR family, sensor kinase